MKAKASKCCSEVDRALGLRVRARRMMLGISQERLGDALGLTFQQVQKYEKGANRISVARLLEIAAFLGNTPLAYFTDNLVEPDAKGRAASPPISPAEELAAVPLGLDLARAFSRIGSGKKRSALLRIAEEFASRPRLSSCARRT